MKLNKPILGAFSIALLSAFAISPVYAGRVCVHGHSGVFQQSDRNAQTNKYGWGLQFSPRKTWEGGDWVHYSIPVDADAKEHQRIRIGYRRGACTHLNQIHIWEGGRKIKNFEGKIDYDDAAINSNSYLYLKLDKPVKFWNGIGVSVQVMHDGGPDCGMVFGSSDHRANIYSVCAFE